MKIPVAVVGATGIAGQQVLAALDGHPDFEIAALAASERSASKTFEEAITDADSGMRRWYVDGGEPPRGARARSPGRQGDAPRRHRAGLRGGRIRSGARTRAASTRSMCRRSAPRGPIGWSPTCRWLSRASISITSRSSTSSSGGADGKAYIATLPNCTATGLAITLKALDQRFGVDAVIVTTMQGISGAGRDLPALDIVENIIPYIPREEERVTIETRKILGRVAEGAIAELPIKVSATCTRASVLAGHTEAVTVGLSGRPRSRT